MSKHRFDGLSFVFGAIFLAVAVAFSVPGLAIEIETLRWMGAAVLVIAGGALMLGSRSRPRGDEPPS